MQVFTESGIRFVFPATWHIKKYDEHRFYRYLSGSGLKGVDFIGIKNDQLLLIEVKNYRDRISLDRHEPMQNLLLEPAQYAQRYRQKFVDSAQLIKIIYTYYQRKFWFRQLFVPIVKRLPTSWAIRRNTGFWWKAYQILVTQESPQEVLWLELGDSISSEQAQELRSTISRLIAPVQIASHAVPYKGIQSSFV